MNIEKLSDELDKKEKVSMHVRKNWRRKKRMHGVLSQKLV